MKRLARALIRKYLKAIDPTWLPHTHPYISNVTNVSEDSFFNDTYDTGLKKSSTPVSLWRRDRFYNLYASLDLVKSVSGSYAECGCWKGQSSFLICSTIKELDKDFAGEEYFIFDSFEGLSEPTNLDVGIPAKKGFYSSPIDRVKEVLNDFPAITFIKGWIPQSFKRAEEKLYKFVHVDLDLAQPTIDSIEYFFPRLVPGGIIICDDYGSKHWKGTKKIIDNFCEKNKIKALRLTTGQIIIFKP